eukprot:Skav223219  [mRNA]  locus=scaffold2231:81451:81888:+ [translate_table: standard]
MLFTYDLVVRLGAPAEDCVRDYLEMVSSDCYQIHGAAVRREEDFFDIQQFSVTNRRAYPGELNVLHRQLIEFCNNVTGWLSAAHPDHRLEVARLLDAVSTGLDRVLDDPDLVREPTLELLRRQVMVIPAVAWTLWQQNVPAMEDD